MHKLLAINFGGIGDEILFLPVLESIKNAYPDWHITLLLEPRSKTVRDITDLIDDIKLFDIKKRPLLPGDLLELCILLREGNYDTVISSGSSPLVGCLLFLSGIRQRIGYSSSFLSKLLLTNSVPLNKNQYAASMYHDLVQGLGLTAVPVVPKIRVPPDNELAMQNIVGSHPLKIVIHPGTSRLAIQKGIIKTWPASSWASLISKLLKNPDVQVILAGGPDDELTINEISKAIQENLPSTGKQDSFVSAYGLTRSLADLAGLIAVSDLLICVDSAPMHIAVGLNKPLVAIFGPTDPKRLLPDSPNFKFLTNPQPDEILLTVQNLLPKKIIQ